MTRQQVPNVELARDTARDNLLTNGGFEIWQRGNGPFTTNSWGPDRWTLGWSGSSTLSVSKETSIVSDGSQSSARVTFTAASGYVTLTQPLKMTDLSLRGKSLSFSMRVRCTVASQVKIAAGSDGTAAVYAESAFNVQANQWETLTVSVGAVPSDATVVNLLVYVGFTNPVSCTAYLDNAMLVVGNVAADYAPLHPADDLARCLRYYEVIGNVVGTGEMGAGQCHAVTGAVFPLRYTTKPVVPTITAVGTLSLTGNTGTAIALTSFGAMSQGINSGAVLVGVAGGLALGNATRLLSTASGQYLTIEANP